MQKYRVISLCKTINRNNEDISRDKQPLSFQLENELNNASGYELHSFQYNTTLYPDNSTSITLIAVLIHHDVTN
jgi:hypothetical protein